MKFRNVFLATVLCISGNALAYSGGNGEPNTPYQISNVYDFLQLSDTPTDWDKSFILTADITLSGLTFTASPIAPDTDNVTSLFQGTQFTGILNGDDHIISNLTITAPTQDFVGLIGEVFKPGQVRKLGVENVITTGRSYVGGLVGRNYSGTITDCYATGSVSGTDTNIGGLAGAMFAFDASSPVTVSNSYATVSVSGTGTNVGGLVGWNNNRSLIASCYATGSVSGNYNTGGLVGMQSWDGGTTHSYATGSVSGYEYVGGLVGWDSGGEIRHCYAIGLVSGMGTNVGGLAGRSDCGGINHCFWNIQTSQASDGVGNVDPDPAQVMGRTTAEMITLSTFTLAGWDFTNETTNGSDDYWRMCANGIEYPRLNWKSIDSDFACPDGVNTEDLDAFIPRWLTETCTLANNFCGGADINKTGTVDLADFAIFADNWLAGV